jgi:glycosyltransferase involved in cell wall biosynthesis
MKENEYLCKYRVLNLVDSSLSNLKKKGNFEYAERLYNPLNFFSEVYHISLFPEDKGLTFKNESIKVHVLKSFFWDVPLLKYIVNIPVFLFQILRIAKQYKIDIIRGRGPFRSSFLGLVIGKILRIPFVVSLGGDNRIAQKLEGRYYILNNKWLSYKLEEIVLKDADAVLCPNNFTYRYVVNLGVVPTKIFIVPHRLPDHLFSFKFKKSKIFQENGVDENRAIVLFVGRLERDKQVEVLIDTIPLILKENSEVQFSFIGDGSLLDVLKGRSRELGVERNVWFLGYQDTGTIKYCLEKCSVVWIPMSGFVVYEAAAVAKPIVAFDVEWHSEFIRNEKTGLLVEDRNVKECAKAVLKLLMDKDFSHKLGINAKTELHKNYNTYWIATREIDIYKKLILKRAIE